MITTEKLKTLKEILSESCIQIDELLRVRTTDKLFKNSEEYYTQLKCVQYVPQDFYKCRLFDTEITLNFSRKSKEFYIKMQTTHFDFTRNISYTEFIHDNKLKILSVYPDNLYINKDLEFNNVIKLFYKFCNLILSFYLSEESLFYYK